MPACRANRSNSADVKHAALSATSTRGAPCRRKNSLSQRVNHLSGGLTNGAVRLRPPTRIIDQGEYVPALHVVLPKWPDKIDNYHLHGRKWHLHLPRRCSSTAHMECLTPSASVHVRANVPPHALLNEILLDSLHGLDGSAVAATLVRLADHIALVPRWEHNTRQQRAPCCGNRSQRKTRPI